MTTRHPSTPWTVAKMQAAAEGTMHGHHGFRSLEVERGRCVGALDYDATLSQPAGLFHTGAIVLLADVVATQAALTVTDPEATRDPALFPLAVQLSLNLLRNTGEGRIVAEAKVVHGGRLTQVVETRVTDGEGRLLALMTTTHVVPPKR